MDHWAAGFLSPQVSTFLDEIRCRSSSHNAAIMLLPPYTPLLIYLKLLHNFLNERKLIYFHLKISIFLNPIISFTLKICDFTRSLIVVLVLLQDVEHKLFPEVELIGAVDDAWSPIYFYCDFSGDEVEEVNIALVDHIGRVQEHVLLIAKGLHQKLQESLDAWLAALK